MSSRIVHHGDGIAWLEQANLAADHAIVTSLPDASELPALGFEGWRQWFVDTSALICRRTPPESVAVFFQTDIKHDGRWIDKAHLAQLGADSAGCALLWHKIVCRIAPGRTTFGRPAYAHLLCFSRELRLESSQSSPDVIPRLGEMPWSRAMGVEACETVIRFLLAHTACRAVVDPFCGIGTMLAVANRHELDAIGVEISAKRAAKARVLQLSR